MGNQSSFIRQTDAEILGTDASDTGNVILRARAIPVAIGTSVKAAVVAEDAATRQALKLILESSGVCQVGYCPAGSVEAAFRRVACSSVEIVLIDLPLRGQSGITCVQELLRRRPRLKVVLFTDSLDGSLLMNALAAGVAGYVVKPFRTQNFLSDLKAILGGSIVIGGEPARLKLACLRIPVSEPPQIHFRLTPREQEVMRLVGDGLTDDQISGMLQISLSTVKTHLRNVYLKSEATCRAAAVMRIFGHPHSPEFPVVQSAPC